MRVCQFLLLAGYLLGSPMLLAQESPAQKIKAAEGQLRQGNAAAAEKVLLTIETPPPKAVSLLGQVQLKLKKYEEALKTYERYVTAEPSAGKKAAGEQMVSELKTLMKTRFKIATTPPGATVFIDSKAEGAVGKTPLSQMVT